MKIFFKILIISILYLSTLISCEKNDDSNTSSDDIRIKQIITEGPHSHHADTISFEYNENNLLIKCIDSEGNYSTREYDSIFRIVIAH